MFLLDTQRTSANAVFSRNNITCHKISLLVLIREFCQAPWYQTTLLEQQVRYSRQQLRDFSATILKLIMKPDIDLRTLRNIVCPVLHSTCYELFIGCLSNIRRHRIAALMNLFTTLNPLFEKKENGRPFIHKSSVLGIFIRQMILAFENLSFSLQTKLCHNFYIYYDDAFDNAENIGEDIKESTSDEFLILASKRQAEFFIAQQASFLQINENVALSPKELQQKIKEFVKGNPELYEACFLSYMNSMRVKEYCGAKDSLFHHFDRSTNIPQEGRSSVQSEDFIRSSRYAALNLAIMHAKFDHKDQAIAALNEAIMLAQEVNDDICLQYALVWLYRMTDENKEIMIERSIVKSTELGLWSLSSLGLQAMAKLKSETIDGPSSVFKLLERSHRENCHYLVTDMLGSTYVLKAGVWSYYGHRRMAMLLSQALLLLNTSDPVCGGIYHIGEGFCLGLRNLAVSFASQGYYAESSKILSLACDLFPPNTEHSHIWQLASLLIAFEKSLHRGKWKTALHTQKGIAVFDKNEARLRKAQLFINQGNLHDADCILKKLLDEQETKPISPHFYTRTLLLRAELLANTPNEDVATPLLMTCLAKSKVHHLLGLEGLTTMQIAKSQLELGLPQQAKNLLNLIMASIMNHGTAFDKGCIFYLYARCLAYNALKNLKNNFDGSKKELLLAVAVIDKALAYLKKIQAVPKMKKVLSYKAHLYHYLYMKDERNNVAHRYRYLEDEFV